MVSNWWIILIVVPFLLGIIAFGVVKCYKDRHRKQQQEEELKLQTQRKLNKVNRDSWRRYSLQNYPEPYPHMQKKGSENRFYSSLNYEEIHMGMFKKTSSNMFFSSQSSGKMGKESESS